MYRLWIADWKLSGNVAVYRKECIVIFMRISVRISIEICKIAIGKFPVI